MVWSWIVVSALVLAGPEAALRRGDVQVISTADTAPTGLPIAGGGRRWVHGGEVRATLEGTPITAVHWAAPSRTAAEVRSLAEAAGYRVLERPTALHDPADGRVRWRVEVAFDAVRGRRPQVWVEDRSARVWEDIDQVRHVAALAYPRNPVLDPEPAVFELEGLGASPRFLADGRFDLRQCADPGQLAACVLQPVSPSAQGDFVFPAPSSGTDHADGDDAFAAASIAVHAQQYAAFAEQHGLPLAPCLEAGEVGTLVANYRGFTGEGVIPVANAGYTGDCGFLAFFGQGAAADWGYDADVIVHELAHGTIDARMGEGRVLGRTRRRADAVVDDAGAINEALADFVAAVVTGDPGHAEYVRAYDGGTMRNAENELRCPQDLVGQIHFDSEPLTGALWEAYEEVGEELVEPVIDAVAMLPEDATFEEVSAALRVATESELGAAARDSVEAALERHGLVDCARVSAVETVRGPLWLRPRFGSSGRYDPMRPPPQQLRVDVPADVTTMELTFEIVVVPDPGWDPVGDVHVLVQTGEPVAFAYDVDAEGRTTVTAEPEQHVASINDGRLTLDVEPGSSVHLAFFNQGLHLTRVGNFAVSFSQAVGSSSGGASSGSGGGSTGGETDGDASSGSGGQGAVATGGGGCRTAPGSGPWGLLFLVGGLRWMRRRLSPRDGCA